MTGVALINPSTETSLFFQYEVHPPREIHPPAKWEYWPCEPPGRASEIANEVVATNIDDAYDLIRQANIARGPMKEKEALVEFFRAGANEVYRRLKAVGL